MKVLALRKLFGHMGGHSGYDLLFNHLEKEVQLESVWESDKNLSKRLNKLDTSVFQGVLDFKVRKYKGIKGIVEKWLYSKRQQLVLNFKSHVPLATGFYNNSCFQAEWEFVEKLIKGNFDLAYLGYVENNMGLLGNPEIRKKITCPLIGTVHQPMSWWKQKGDFKLLQTLDEIIVLAESEKMLWEKIYPGKVTCIPHGVDADFYKPSKLKNNTTPAVLFVGIWLRDIEVLARVAKIVSQKRDDIIFKLVVPVSQKKDYTFYKWLFELAKLENVEWCSGLSDQALLELYQESTLTFLPMMDCTANNAILESIACGKPIVSTKLKGLETYLTSECAELYDCLEIDAMANAVISIIDDENKRLNMEVASRKQAEVLSWGNITPQLLERFQKWNLQ